MIPHVFDDMQMSHSRIRTGHLLVLVSRLTPSMNSALLTRTTTPSMGEGQPLLLQLSRAREWCGLVMFRTIMAAMTLVP